MKNRAHSLYAAVIWSPDSLPSWDFHDCSASSRKHQWPSLRRTPLSRRLCGKKNNTYWPRVRMSLAPSFQNLASWPSLANSLREGLKKSLPDEAQTLVLPHVTRSECVCHKFSKFIYELIFDALTVWCQNRHHANAAVRSAFWRSPLIALFRAFTSLSEKRQKR